MKSYVDWIAATIKLVCKHAGTRLLSAVLLKWVSWTILS
jgi:hypothetical protein